MAAFKQEVMVDLETMGQSFNAAIIAIGAVKFDNKLGITDEFYRVIDLQSSVDAGGVIDPSTIMWWMGQSDAARSAVIKQGEHIAATLISFSDWLGPDAAIWGNGSDFDNVILGSAYQRLQLDIPWKFWNNRCFRTVKDLYRHVPVDSFAGTAHNALDDAKHQALHLLKIRKYSNG